MTISTDNRRSLESNGGIEHHPLGIATRRRLVGRCVMVAVLLVLCVSPRPHTPPAHAATVVEIATGYAFSCLLTSDGAVLCWGANVDGRLGDGTLINRLTPVPVVGLSSGVTAVSLGGDHGCAIKNGGVWCWGGANAFGQIGDGTTTPRLTPVAVLGLSSGVVAISAGDAHTCAINSSGAALCWGINGAGQVGDGSTTDRRVPTPVVGLASGVVEISAKGGFTCALVSGGAMKCWGYNATGSLGDGTTSNRLAPVQVSGLASGVISISAGDRPNCAVIVGGAAKCWGENGSGEVGDGTTTQRNSPVTVWGLSSGVSKVHSGINHACALLTSGSVVCWGANNSGQLGNGTTTPSLIPVAVVGLGGTVSALATGASHNCVLVPYNSVQCWGDNTYGEIGDGTTTDRFTPVYVTGYAPPPPDFALSCAPAALPVVLGSSTTSTCTVTSHYGFTGTVNLACPNAPAGLTCTFNPAAVTPATNGTVTSTLTIVAAAGAGPGPVALTVRATSGALSHDITLDITKTPAPDFSVTCAPSSLSVAIGASETSTCTVASVAGFSSAVALICPSAPAGLFCAFVPPAPVPSAGGSVESTLTVSATAAATPGAAALLVRGISGALSHDTTVNITITPAPSFTLACVPPALTVARGGAADTICTVTSIGGWTGTVTLLCLGEPAGVECAFSPPAPTPAANGTIPSTLTISASNAATLGTTVFHVTGISGSLSRETSFSVTTTITPDFRLTCVPSALSVPQGGTNTTACTITSVGSFSAAVALGCPSAPSGVFCSFAPPSLTPTAGGSAFSTLTIIATAGAPLATGPLTVRGTNGALSHDTGLTVTVRLPGVAPGDVNNDGQTSIVDALCVARDVAGLPATPACPSPLVNPDVNGDGAETIVDALCIARAVAGLTLTLACPNPLGSPLSPASP